LLILLLLSKQNKKEGGEKSGRVVASLATGIRLATLSGARNLTSTNSDTSNSTGKMTTQK
jgi:hypothetical protein